MKNENTKKFFNEVALFYDEMIDFENALIRRVELLRPYIDNYKTAADFGCGSGLDSIALTQLGLKVTAFDQSKGMIITAKTNAEKFNAKIDFVVSSIDEIPADFNKTFDLIVSLGNTLANLSEEQLKKSLLNMKGFLKTDGIVLVQIVNFYKIIEHNFGIINKIERPNFSIKRYYEYEKDELFFKISVLDKTTQSEDVISTKIFPHSSEKLLSILSKIGFSKILLYGSLSKQKFNKNSSNDIIVVTNN